MTRWKVRMTGTNDKSRIEILVEPSAPGSPQPDRGPWRIAISGGGLLLLEHAGHVAVDGDVDPRPVALLGPIGSGGRLVDIIASIATARWSGTLCALGDGARRDLHFDSGAIRWASSSSASDRLGELMHRAGRISRAQLDTALATVGPNRRIGEALVKSGAATEADVFAMISRQVEDVFWAVIAMRSGAFWFREGPSPGGLPVRVSLDTNNLLMEGMRRIDEMAYFRKLIPGPNIVLQRKTRSFPPRSAHGSAEDLFLGMCDGRRTLDQIARDSGLGEFETTRLAHRLLQDQAIEVVPTEATKDDSIRFIVDRFNETVDVIAREIGRSGRDGAFLAAVREFPSSGGELSHLALSVSIDELGHLDARNLALVLQDIKSERRIGTLMQVLTRYIFFALFIADRFLTREQHRLVGADVHGLLQKIGA